MISLVRVDNRLLHGQILEAWVPCLKAEAVLVADDDAAQSELARAAMTLCVPPDLLARVERLGGVDWAAVSASGERTLVLVREVADLARAAANGLTPQRAARVNLGNVHYARGRRPITPSVFLSEAEVEAVRELARAGFEIEARAIPSEPPAGAEEIEQRYRAAR